MEVPGGGSVGADPAVGRFGVYDKSAWGRKVGTRFLGVVGRGVVVERREDGEGGRVGRTGIVRREVHRRLSYPKDGETDAKPNDDEETCRTE